jgi:hypothetical protein
VIAEFALMAAHSRNDVGRFFPSLRARGILIVLKGPSSMTTSTSDVTVRTEHDLFSHPYTYQWHGQSDPRTGSRVSRENLFSEPVDPNRPAHPVPGGQAKRPPRNPFDRSSSVEDPRDGSAPEARYGAA